MEASPMKTQYYDWREVPPLVKEIMALATSTSIGALVRKLYPVWKKNMSDQAYRLFPFVRGKMDTRTTNKWADEIASEVVDRLLLQREMSRYSCADPPAAVHLLFEYGTDIHVQKLNALLDPKVLHADKGRSGIPLGWQNYKGPIRSEAWKPFVRRLVEVAMKDSVERLLKGPPYRFVYRPCNLCVWVRD